VEFMARILGPRGPSQRSYPNALRQTDRVEHSRTGFATTLDARPARGRAAEACFAATIPHRPRNEAPFAAKHGFAGIPDASAHGMAIAKESP
jgi:hypothetical protein